MTDHTLRRRLMGVFTALVTPFRGGAVDVPALEQLIEAQIAAGIAGLVPVGTTGEAATLSDDEAKAVIRTTVQAAAGRAFVMAGAGANATRLAIAKAERAKAAGADGLLLRGDVAIVEGGVDRVACVLGPLLGPGQEVGPDRIGRAAMRYPVEGLGLCRRRNGQCDEQAA